MASWWPWWIALLFGHGLMEAMVDSVVVGHGLMVAMLDSFVVGHGLMVAMFDSFLVWLWPHGGHVG